MSFEVVLDHFWHDKSAINIFQKPFAIMGGWAVPVFMFMSFILTSEIFITRNSNKISKRFKKLILTQILWCIIPFVIYVIAKIAFGKGIFKEMNTYEIIFAFFKQLILAQSFNNPLWFQFDLIFLTLLFAVIYYRANNHISFWLIVLTFAAYFLQYSGINFMLFGNLPPSLKWILGRFSEMIPFAVAGLLFGEYKILDKLASRKYTSIIICALLLFSATLPKKIFKLELAQIAAPGFMYQGIFLLLAAIFMTIIFYLTPFEKLPATLLKIIKKISSYILGVYCMHIFVGRFVSYIFPEDSEFTACILIYCVCIFISFVIDKLFKKWSVYLVK